ncbi:hypothetical protein Tco_0908088 [Tanacetum coccineum]|uniref:Uncharacterized protein n=1 Tax=Tanacetum coccineum TaxID=301880 RepID=A0ABQ5CN95_9ASTR
MWNSIQNEPYERPMITNPDDTKKEILKPLSKMTTANKSQYIADVKVMIYLLQTIPNDIYNSVDACKNAKEMWERIKRLMFGSDVTSHVRHSRLMDEFDMFAAKEGEALRRNPQISYAVTHQKTINRGRIQLLELSFSLPSDETTGASPQVVFQHSPAFQEGRIRCERKTIAGRRSIPKTLHTTPPNEDYVAPTTKSILDDLLEEFGDEILNVTMVDEGAKCNPAKDLEEIEILLAKEPQSNFTEIQDLEEIEILLAKEPQSNFTEIQIYAFGISFLVAIQVEAREVDAWIQGRM